MKRLAILAFSALIGQSSQSHIVAQWGNEPETMKINKVFQPTMTCEQNTDCHMCSLSSCRWSGTSCSGTPQAITFDWWRSNAGQCSDNLNICKAKSEYARKCQTSHCDKGFDDFNKELIHYNPDKRGTVIPKGYYCYSRFQVNKEFNPLMYWNRTDSWARGMEFHDDGANVAHDQLMYISTFWRREGKNAGDRYYNLNDEELYNQKDNNKFSLVFGLQNTYYVDMGWINTRERKLDDQQEKFQMVILKTTSYSEYASLWRQAYPVAAFFISLFVCCFCSIFCTACCCMIWQTCLKSAVEKFRADRDSIQISEMEPLLVRDDDEQELTKQGLL